MLLIVALFLCLSQSLLCAQRGFPERIPDSGLLLSQPAARNSDEMKQLMYLYIDDMATTLKLDSKQVSKLRLTANAISKKLVRPPGKVPGVFGIDPNVGQDTDTFSDQDKEYTPEENEGLKKTLMTVVMPVKVSRSLKHEMWTQATDSVLTDNQKEAWATVEKDRQKQTRNAVTHYRTWHLAQRLNLTDEQIEPVAKIVDRLESNWYVRNINIKAFNVLIPGKQHRVKQVTAKDLAGTLTDSQKEAFGRYLKNDSVLSREALTALAPADEQRAAKVRKAAVDYRVWHLASRLRLRMDQIPAVTEVVDAVEGDTLATAILQKKSKFIDGQNGFVSVSTTDLQEVLSDDQLRLLGAYVKSSIRRNKTGGSTTKPSASGAVK